MSVVEPTGSAQGPALCAAVPPLLLVLDVGKGVPGWLAAIRFASQRYSWSAPPECRFLSHCTRPELWADAALSRVLDRLAAIPADKYSYAGEAISDERQYEDSAVDHAMSLLLGTAASSIYRPAPTDERRIVGIVVPGSSALDLRLGSRGFGHRQSCGFWTNDLRLDLRSRLSIQRPVWVPRLPVEESAMRIIDTCHVLSRTLANLRHLGLTGVDGRYDFWS